jgi:hypothetical protein
MQTKPIDFDISLLLASEARVRTISDHGAILLTTGGLGVSVYGPTFPFAPTFVKVLVEVAEYLAPLGAANVIVFVLVTDTAWVLRISVNPLSAFAVRAGASNPTVSFTWPALFVVAGLSRSAGCTGCPFTVAEYVFVSLTTAPDSGLPFTVIVSWITPLTPVFDVPSDCFSF